MKKIILGISFLLIAFCCEAQFDGLLNKAKRKAEDKVISKSEKKADDAVDGKKSGNENKNENNSAAASDANENAPAPAGIKVYSKFDFVPGEKIVVMDDFTQDAVGDFPDKWNTNSS